MKIKLFLCCIVLNLSCLTMSWAESASSVETALENYRQQNAAYDAALQTFYTAKNSVAEKQTALANAQKEVENSQAQLTVKETLFKKAMELEKESGEEISPAIKKKYFDVKAQLDAAQANVSTLEKAVQEAVQQQNTAQNATVQAWEKLDRMRTALAEARFQMLQQQIEQQKEVSVAFEHACGEEMAKKQCREQAMERAKRDAIEKGAAILVDAVSEAKLVKDASGVPQLKLTKDDIRTESSGLVLSLQSVRSEFMPNGNYLLEIKVVVKGQTGETLKERVFNQTAAIPALPEAVKAGLSKERVFNKTAAIPALPEAVKTELSMVPQSTSFSSTNPQPSKSFRDRLKDGSLGPEMVWIPAGMFQMGSNNGDSDEKPVHPVSVKSFAMGKYEVKRGEFRNFVEATGYETEAEKGDGCYGWTGSERKKDSSFNWKNPGFTQDYRHPVVCVSWNDAKAYTKWLSEQTGKEYRLPSEAQWEYACRAGSTGKYSFGDDENQLGNYGWYDDENAGSQTHPVGEKQANKFGLYDMHGNVWEWLEDVWHDNYEGAPSDGSAWTAGGDSNVHLLLHGGSWYNNDNWLRCAFRSTIPATHTYGSRGLRLSRVNF
jgi:formylglycine-generating enzyme required for sulfatase activity